MYRAAWCILVVLLSPYPRLGRAGQAVLEYPTAMLDLYDADRSCWKGMDALGSFPVAVVPERWLVGPPLSEDSAVTFPTDHWVDLAFSGEIVAGDGNDITLVETGRAGEQALVFVTDGAEQEYLLTKLVVEYVMKQELTRFGIDLDGLRLPFVPRAVRVVAVDRGGQSPGFDLCHVQARVSHACGTRACSPNPISGSVGVSGDIELGWSPGCSADGHVVYFSEIASDVRSGSAAVRYPAQPPDANTFQPTELRLGETYYWRVDEIAAGDPNRVRPGDVWSFTVADRLVIDDFESYDQGEHFLYDVWHARGLASVSIEQRFMLSCVQSMGLWYHYEVGFTSEALRIFEEPQDWTRIGAAALQLMLHGEYDNATTGQMYIIIGDGEREQQIPYSGDMAALGEMQWFPWRIPLADFNEVDVAHVTTIAIGLHLETTDPEPSGRGKLYIDDIALYPALCLEDNRPLSDVTADCVVDYRDLDRMALDWLDDRMRVHPVAAPNEPILWYPFDGNADDIAGSAHGHTQGRFNYAPGVYGQAIHFANQGDTVSVPEALAVFGRAREAITIAFWQKGDDSSHLNDTICCSNYVYGQSNPAIAIHLGCWRGPGRYRWDCGSPWSFENRLAGVHRDKSDWTGRWNHWAFTKDVRVGPVGRKGRMEIYLNGVLYDSRERTDTPITDITSFEIGSGWYGHYDGLIDDFQIYDYALSPAEIAYVATDGFGVFHHRPASKADLDGNDEVDLHDFAVLASEWLEDQLWP